MSWFFFFFGPSHYSLILKGHIISILLLVSHHVVLSTARSCLLPSWSTLQALAAAALLLRLSISRIAGGVSEVVRGRQSRQSAWAASRGASSSLTRFLTRISTRDLATYSFLSLCSFCAILRHFSSPSTGSPSSFICSLFHPHARIPCAICLDCFRVHLASFLVRPLCSRSVAAISASTYMYQLHHPSVNQSP
jgi:hypothetical protein